MPRLRKLELTASQNQELVYHRDHHEKPYVRERCAALLKISSGQSAHSVALGGLFQKRKADTLYRWLDLYEQSGIEGLISHQQVGAHRRLV